MNVVLEAHEGDKHDLVMGKPRTTAHGLVAARFVGD